MSIMLSQGISLQTSTVESLVSDKCLGFFTEEDFNNALSQDIWQQVMLLPTPPLSPDRDTKQTDSNETESAKFDVDLEELLTPISIEEELREVLSPHNTDLTELLKPKREKNPFLEIEDKWPAWPEEDENCCELKNGLLHDCMWSGTCVLKQNTLKCGPCCEMESDSHTIVHPPSVWGFTVNTTLNQQQRVATDLGYTSKQVVNPSSVLPYTPLNDHCYYQATTNDLSQTSDSGTGDDDFESDTPSDSGKLGKYIRKRFKTRKIRKVHKPKAEIDVVTIPEYHQPDSLKRPGRRKLNVQIKNGRNPSKSLKLTLGLSNEKRVSRKSRNRKRTRENESVKKLTKKLKLNYVNAGETQKSVCGHSPCNSDCEDIEKRSQHNSMERKRRNDLKFLFQRLRAQLIELADNVKASKVLILNTARQALIDLASKGIESANIYEELSKKKLLLTKKLLSLRGSLRR